VHDPKNVILDEPTNGLDVMTTRGLREFLLRLKGEGRCVILSSHIMQEVGALCDHIVVIAKGRVTAQGSPDELRAPGTAGASTTPAMGARRPVCVGGSRPITTPSTARGPSLTATRAPGTTRPCRCAGTA
jgi:ABC-type glutathione transport system ATPase component